MASDVMRLRCPAATDPATHERHIRVDVRLPCPVGRYLVALAEVRCPCGERRGTVALAGGVPELHEAPR